MGPLKLIFEKIFRLKRGSSPKSEFSHCLLNSLPMNWMKFHQLFSKVLQRCFAASAVFSGRIFSMWVSNNDKFNSRGDLLRLPAPLILLTDQWWAIPVIIRFFNATVTKRSEAKPYHVIFTLSLQVFKHHGFAAAAGEWPWRTDEHPDEGVCQGGAQALCQAEKVWGLATADICSSLVAQQRWWWGETDYTWSQMPYNVLKPR